MKMVLIVAGVLAFATSVMAAPISYTETWDYYVLGTDDVNYNANWATMPDVARYPVSISALELGIPYSPPKNLDQIGGLEDPENPESPGIGVAYGIENNLADGVEMAVGEVVVGTGASPLEVSLWWLGDGTNRSGGSVSLWISKGDNELAIANCSFNGGVGDSNRCQFYNGTSWSDTRLKILPSEDWINFKMTIAGNTVTVTSGTGGTKMYTVAYGGGYDTISIRSAEGTTHSFMFDDVSVTGGDIVPEPATVLLLGLGGLALLRRRR